VDRSRHSFENLERAEDGRSKDGRNKPFFVDASFNGQEHLD
jgi:hypothetical protein